MRSVKPKKSVRKRKHPGLNLEKYLADKLYWETAILKAEADKRVLKQELDEVNNWRAQLRKGIANNLAMLDAVCRALETAECFCLAWHRTADTCYDERDALANRVKSLEEQLETVNSQVFGEAQKVQELEAHRDLLKRRLADYVIRANTAKAKLYEIVATGIRIGMGGRM